MSVTVRPHQTRSSALLQDVFAHVGEDVHVVCNGVGAFEAWVRLVPSDVEGSDLQLEVSDGQRFALVVEAASKVLLPGGVA
jgi:hypothetical protein